jgi:hypothetical protein
MTGFESKRKASLDTLDHMPYQGRPSRPEELAPKPVAWMLASALDDLQMDQFVEVTKKQEEPDDVPLYLYPAPAAPNPWREAIDSALICAHLGTVDSFLNARAALNALIDWHVAVALDPEVSSDAQALIDRGAAAPVPAVPDLAHKPTVQRLMDLARQFRSAPSDLYDEPYKALQQACYAALAARPAPVQSAARAIAEEQSYDSGLWFVAQTATEAHLQAALRRLTAAVEGEPVARTPLGDEKVWMLATQCTVGSDLHIDKFARAIEAAHGIGDKT